MHANSIGNIAIVVGPDVTPPTMVFGQRRAKQAVRCTEDERIGVYGRRHRVFGNSISDRRRGIAGSIRKHERKCQRTISKAGNILDDGNRTRAVGRAAARHLARKTVANRPRVAGRVFGVQQMEAGRCLVEAVDGIRDKLHAVARWCFRVFHNWCCIDSNRKGLVGRGVIATIGRSAGVGY